MAYEFIRVDRDGPVTIFTLNRPEVMNALHSPAHFELDEAFNAFAADPDQWVGVVTGAGDRAFSAGNDLKHQAGGGGMTLPPSGFAGLTSRFDLTKPLIAAVNGVAMGGGFEIALACDLVIASETATFALPEPRVGLAALAGGLHRLPRAIGQKQALGMILTGRRVTAQEGLALGFVNEVAAPGALISVAQRWAAQICELSPMSIRASKEAVYKGLDEPTLEAAMAAQNRYPAMAALFKSADFVEGPLAFAQKRAPAWKGR
ncbi:enoyl-CoA hydratase-related protein [Phenylobacterium koreense]|uniref:Crotonobetainyl-CoA hydratase n=1 Tax=Phenylobacterium koreense TaxID=266125 RepID=A0ABV2EM21_9CAUL